MLILDDYNRCFWLKMMKAKRNGENGKKTRKKKKGYMLMYSRCSPKKYQIKKLLMSLGKKDYFHECLKYKNLR